MSKPFDMELFLTSVLTGSHATRQRHLRQANTIQKTIAERWQREDPSLEEKTSSVLYEYKIQKLSKNHYVSI